MKRLCEKMLTAIEYNGFRGQFPAESNKKLSERKGYFKEDLCKNLSIISLAYSLDSSFSLAQ